MKIISLFIILAFMQTASAQNVQRYAFIGDLALENGDTLYNCEIGYRTAGILNPDSGNVIIYPTWFGGSSENLYSLLGEKKLLDTSGFYIIMIDALCNGISTSPSNADERNRSKFPIVTIKDMVESQYHILTKVMNLRKIYGALGGSMGSMQVLQWRVQYPGFIEKSIAYVATPKPTVYDQLLWNLHANIIESGSKNNIAPAEYMKSVNLLTQLTARTPDYLVENITQEKFDTLLARSFREPSTVFTPMNQHAQLRAMLRHDIYKYAGNQKISNFINEDVFLIVSKQDHILHPANALQLAQETKCQLKIFESNCGHLVVGCFMDETRELIESFLKQ